MKPNERSWGKKKTLAARMQIEIVAKTWVQGSDNLLCGKQRNGERGMGLGWSWGWDLLGLCPSECLSSW